MCMQTLSFSGFLHSVFAGTDMTADLASLFIGLRVVLGLGVLGLAVATAIHDTREVRCTARRKSSRPPSISALAAKS
jgi:hypothetical protein